MLVGRSLIVLRGGADELGGVGVEAAVEVGEPLAVDEGFEDAAYLEAGFSVVDPAQETQLDDLRDMGVNLVDEPGIGTAAWHEDGEHIDDLLAGDDQARLATGGVEFSEFLA